MDRRPPGPAREERRRLRFSPRDRSHRSHRPRLRALRQAGARAARREHLRCRELERHRDRLDLRWPWHLQEVPGPGARRHRPCEPSRHEGIHRRADRRWLAPGLPRECDVQPAHRRASDDDASEGGNGRGRPPGDPAAEPRQALSRARRPEPFRPALRHRPGARRRHRPHRAL